MRTECPNCGGEIWDNRESKRSGEFKPNAPDFACKDKDGCGWKDWPPKKKKTGPGPSSGKSGASGGRPPLTWPELAGTYSKCLQLAASKLSQNLMADSYTGADVVAAAATLFIQAMKRGVEPLKRPKPEQPAKQPDPPAEPWDGEDQDDLPF